MQAWYHNDHLGTPLALSDESGAVVAEWVRDPFGNVVSKTGTVEDNHMFPGQFWDEEAQLAYNWNRWYSPEIGRYTQVDRNLTRAALYGIGDMYLAGDAKRLNAYGYANSNPLSNIDFRGNECVNIATFPSGFTLLPTERQILNSRVSRAGTRTEGMEAGPRRLGVPWFVVFCKLKRESTVRETSGYSVDWTTIRLCVDDCGRAFISTSTFTNTHRTTRTFNETSFFERGAGFAMTTFGALQKCDQIPLPD